MRSEVEQALRRQKSTVCHLPQADGARILLEHRNQSFGPAGIALTLPHPEAPRLFSLDLDARKMAQPGSMGSSQSISAASSPRSATTRNSSSPIMRGARNGSTHNRRNPVICAPHPSSSPRSRASARM